MAKKVRIDPFLDEEGKIKQLPQKHNARYAVLEYLAGRFEPDRIYSEPEVNVICENWHTFGDYFLLRRELVESGLICRTPNGALYWRVKIDPEAEAEAVVQPEA